MAVRNLLRQKGYSFINILGLALGLGACILLFLWVQDEFSFDRYHDKADQIHRVVQRYYQEGNTESGALTPAILASSLRHEFPWIRRAVRMARAKYLVESRGKFFNEEIFLADPEIFQVFTFPLVAGDPGSALENPDSILISEEMRDKYFGKENPVGQVITLDRTDVCKITGVFKNIPANSHFRFHFLGSLAGMQVKKDTWGISNFWTYVLLEKGSSPKTFNEKMPQFVAKYRGREFLDTYKFAYLLQPLTDIHLHSHLQGEIDANRDITSIYIFCAVALFLLVIAGLNYINLASARFISRAKEMGIRRVLGAGPGQSIVQSLVEALFHILLALPLALLLADSFLPLFNTLAGKTLKLAYFSNPLLLAGIVAMILLTGLLAGIVPPLIISGSPLPGRERNVFKPKSSIIFWRKALVVFQFALSIAFIICTLVIFDQLKYSQSKDMGLDRENVIAVRLNHQPQAITKCETIKQEFLKSPGVVSACASDFLPGPPTWNMNYWHEGMGPTENHGNIGCLPVDHDFFHTLEMEIVAGRGFSRDFSTDTKSFVLNEAAVRKFGWPDPRAAVGKRFKIGGLEAGVIIGVVKDFHYRSLHEEIAPLALWPDPAVFSTILVRLNPGHISNTIAFLKEKWRALLPGHPFGYSFLDDDYRRLYGADNRLLQIVGIIAVIAILIACMGLYGLGIFSAGQRTKEIGIRKVLGASVMELTLMLAAEFAAWVAAANILAWPLAWYIMNGWLENFAYRVPISPWTFPAAGLLALFIALLTVGYRALRAAAADPVQSLRYE